MRNLFTSAKGHIIQAISAPVAGAGGSFIMSMQNDVIRIFGITLANWSLILGVSYSLLQFILAVRKSRKGKEDD